MKALGKYLLVSVILVSCTPQKRLNRLIANYPYLVEKDTINVTIRDTIIIESIVHDTTTQLVKHDSTIIVNNEKVLLKYFYDTLTREIHHRVECKQDTVWYQKEVPVIIEKVVQKELTTWQKILVFTPLLLFIGMILILKYVKN